MKNSFSILLLFICIITCLGCPKTCIQAVYSFNATIQIAPDIDSIKVGDTIYVIAKIPYLLNDQNTGTEVNYTGAENLGSDLFVSKLEPGKLIPTDAVADFDYFSLIGRIFNDRTIPSPDGVQQLFYQGLNDSYQLKVGVIPKTKGVFALGTGNGVSVGRKNSSNCEKAAFNISISNTSQHIYYYQQWQPGYVLDDYSKSQLFCFKVY